MLSRNLFSFLILLTFTSSWSQADEEIWIGNTENWLNLKAAQQHEGTYWALGGQRLEIPGQAPVQQLINFDDRGTVKHTFTSEDLPNFRGEFLDFCVSESAIFIIDNSGQIYQGDLAGGELKAYTKLNLDDGIRPLVGGFSGAFRRIAKYFIVPQLIWSGAYTQFDSRIFQETEWALAMYDQKGKLYKGLLKYPDLLKKESYGMKGRLSQVAIHNNNIYAYVFPERYIRRFSMKGELLGRIPVPALAGLADRLQKAPEKLLTQPQDFSRDALKERQNLLLQSRSDFISNLKVVDDQTLQYFYHAFDRDENEYQVYQHIFHPPTGQLTKKLVDNDLYAFYFHAQDQLPIAIIALERGKGMVVKKVTK